MTVDLGTDLATLEDGDLNPSLDELVEGAELVAQDLRAECLTREGALFYDETYGLGVDGLVAQRITDVRRARIASRVEAVCLRDDRVAAVQVEAAGELAIDVEGLTSTEEPFRFVLDVGDVAARLSENR